MLPDTVALKPNDSGPAEIGLLHCSTLIICDHRREHRNKWNRLTGSAIPRGDPYIPRSDQTIVVTLLRLRRYKYLRDECQSKDGNGCAADGFQYSFLHIHISFSFSIYFSPNISDCGR